MISAYAKIKATRIEMQQEDKTFQLFRMINSEVKNALAKRKLTLEDLSTIAKVPIMEIEKLENNMGEIKLETINKILSALNLDLKIKIEIRP